MTADESSFNKLAPGPDAPKSLYRKLAEVMGEIGHVPKRGKNAFHKYDYVMEADLVDAVREKLASRNVLLIPSVTAIEERQTQGGKPSTITTVRVAFTFCDGDSGETHTADWAGSGDDPADKGLYKAYTGAVKYFLMKAFLIPTGDDPEADSGTDERSSMPKDVQRNGRSDAPAEDVWWAGTVGPLLKQVNPSAEELRNAVEVAQAEPLPERIASWKVAICKLLPDQRMVFEAWLTQQAAAGTPIA